MEIIPVLDLMNGFAVHARHGRREYYRRLQSPLCGSAEPQAVVAGLLAFHSFKTVYIADLDALMGKPRQADLLNRLKQEFSDLVFWIDSGWPEHEPEEKGRALGNPRTIIGSESLTEARLPLLEQRGRRSFILSLDFRGDELIGPANLLHWPQLWPEDVILMNLSGVGGMRGPDFARTEHFLRAYPGHRYIAAGGVRDAGDLLRLEALGTAAALIASALHSGTLNAEALRQFG